MVMGFKLNELKAYIEQDRKLIDFVLLDIEGEMLAYCKNFESHQEFIDRYKAQGRKFIDLGSIKE